MLKLYTELKDGCNTMLGEWFDKSQELSGGQWQKIALGRAFMRDGELLVLDKSSSNTAACSNTIPIVSF